MKETPIPITGFVSLTTSGDEITIDVNPIELAERLDGLPASLAGSAVS